MSLAQTLAEAKRQSDLLMERGMPMQAGMVDALATLVSEVQAENERLRERVEELVAALEIQHQHLAANKQLPHSLCAVCDLIAGQPALSDQDAVRKQAVCNNVAAHAPHPWEDSQGAWRCGGRRVIGNAGASA